MTHKEVLESLLSGQIVEREGLFFANTTNGTWIVAIVR